MSTATAATTTRSKNSSSHSIVDVALVPAPAATPASCAMGDTVVTAARAAGTLVRPSHSLTPMTEDSTQHARTMRNMATGSPPPASCPIGWQPQALAPVFFGARSLGPRTERPCRCGSSSPAWTAPSSRRRSSRAAATTPSSCSATATASATPTTTAVVPAARPSWPAAGYVVVVPTLAGIGRRLQPVGGGPSRPGHRRRGRDLGAVGWEHSDVLMPPPATGIAGHSYGAMLAARYASEPSRRGIRRAQRRVGRLVR